MNVGTWWRRVLLHMSRYVEGGSRDAGAKVEYEAGGYAIKPCRDDSDVHRIDRWPEKQVVR